MANLFSDDAILAPPEVRVSLIYERDVPIPVRDGTVLRANLYRPVDGGPAPVLVTVGPYGKDVHLAIRDPDHFRALGGGVASGLAWHGRLTRRAGPVIGPTST
jgi:predicted acyl esterase